MLIMINHFLAKHIKIKKEEDFLNVDDHHDINDMTQFINHSNNQLNMVGYHHQSRINESFNNVNNNMNNVNEKTNELNRYKTNEMNNDGIIVGNNVDIYKKNEVNNYNEMNNGNN